MNNRRTDVMKTMSHSFPHEAEEGAADETSDGWTTTNAPISQSLGGRPIALPQLRQNGNRSNPIAIIRSDDDPYSDSSDDEVGDGDTSTIHLELDALRIAAKSGKSGGGSSSSLPSHLLRAPRLTALPDNENQNKSAMQYPAMLPPAMSSAENPLGGLSGVVFGTEDRTSYGSLRDSNSRGRFLDGPSSYRDKNTGDIRALEHRIRYRDGQNMAQSLPASLSIGERIMQSRVKRKENAPVQDNSQPTSSLSALMEASTDDHQVSSPQQAKDTMQQLKNRTVTFYDEDSARNLPADMLSTSLTGLEILQAGFRGNACASAQPNYRPTTTQTNLDKLPRDEFGNNGMLSRSLSDPTPEQARPSPNNSYLPDSDGTVSPLHLATYQNLHPAVICDPLDSQPLGPLQPSPSHGANPDAEFGFDFDME